MKYLKPNDSKQESKHATYLDTNNLYDYTMPKLLSIRGFKWIEAKKTLRIRIQSTASAKAIC